MSLRIRFASHLLLAALSGWASPAAAQNPTPPATEEGATTALDLSRDPRVGWLREHAAPIRTVDPSDRDYSDLEALRAAIGNARIVMLGEQTHGDGTTFLAKARLIRFLHQEMGFDVIAFESGFYDVAKSWELIEQGEDARTAMRRSLPGISRVEETQTLIDYIERVARTDRPLEIVGVDSQLRGTASADFLASDLRTFLAGIGADTSSLSEGTPLETALRTMGAPGGYTAPDSVVHPTIANLRREVVLRTQNRRSTEVAFWIQVLENLQVAAWDGALTDLLLEVESPWEQRILTAGLERDHQMGRNIIWLARQRYPERKIIVWAANAHIMRNQHLPILLPPRKNLGDFVAMGHTVWEEMGEDVYALVFTAYEGVAGRPGWRQDYPIDPDQTEEVELEELFRATEFEYAFLDLRRPAQGGEWLDELLWARPGGNESAKAPWRTQADGIFHMRLLKPATQAK